jgi:NADP-reducing hydrogenase subunit HndD
MPCTAKKFEISRDNQNGAGVPDVDISITTRELARMLKDAEIQLEAMPADKFDEPLGIGTGAGVIFGASGGVMEAVLRTAEADRGAFKTIAVSGLANAKELLTKVQNGEADYQLIEVMACPGGCVNGGGQPQQTADVRAKTDIRAVRADALRRNDEKSALHKSDENPAITELYKTYLDKPGSEKARKLLHTSYIMTGGK